MLARCILVATVQIYLAVCRQNGSRRQVKHGGICPVIRLGLDLTGCVRLFSLRVGLNPIVVLISG